MKLSLVSKKIIVTWEIPYKYSKKKATCLATSLEKRLDIGLVRLVFKKKKNIESSESTPIGFEPWTFKLKVYFSIHMARIEELTDNTWFLYLSFFNFKIVSSLMK